jgi:hypothetical protein
MVNCSLLEKKYIHPPIIFFDPKGKKSTVAKIYFSLLVKLTHNSKYISSSFVKVKRGLW